MIKIRVTMHKPLSECALAWLYYTLTTNIEPSYQQDNLYYYVFTTDSARALREVLQKDNDCEDFHS